MKLHYYPDTDSLYIDLNANPSIDSREVADRLVIDLDSASRVVGIDNAGLWALRCIHHVVPFACRDSNQDSARPSYACNRSSRYLYRVAAVASE